MLLVPLVLSFVIVSGAAADPSPSDAIAELNQWRGQIGELPVSTVPVAAWNTGCQHHVNYEQLNGQLGHVETSGNPGYTADGAVAGSDSVLAEETGSAALADDTLLPGPIWDAAVFHRAGAPPTTAGEHRLQFDHLPERRNPHELAVPVDTERPERADDAGGDRQLPHDLVADLVPVAGERVLLRADDLPGRDRVPRSGG